MKNAYKFIGKTVPIHDVSQKVSGHLKYACDMELAGMVHAKLITSEWAHARIVSIDTSEAEAMEGVLEVVTFASAPDVLYNSHVWYAGYTSVEDERIFTDTPRHVGDRIGAVIATKKSIAEEAEKKIKIEYEVLPANTDPLQVREQGGSVFKKTIEAGDYEALDDSAYLEYEDRFQTQKIHHAAMEPHVCVAAPQMDGGLTVWTPCQVAFQVRLLVAKVLDMPINDIRVIKTTMGGSFGGKGQPVLEQVTAFLAKHIARPVKLVMSRKEAILGTRTRNAVYGNVKTKVKRDGQIMGRYIDLTVDAGAYFTNADAVAMAMGKKSFRMYRVPHQTYHVESVLTHTPIGGAARGYGSPQVHAITEIHMDRIARRLDMDPAQLRLKNLVHPYDKDPVGGPDLGDARVIDCVKRGCEVFDWETRRQNKVTDGRYIKAVGMACATHGNGYFDAFQDYLTLYMRLDEDGHILLNAGFHDQGCGTITSMKQIVGEVLNLPLENIRIPEVDTQMSPFDSAGTQASRVTYVCGKGAMLASEELKSIFTEKISKVYKTPVKQIRLTGGKVILNGDTEMSYGEAVAKIQMVLNEDISTTFKYKSISNPAVYAVNFAEVEIDTCTGLVRVTDVLAVHDIGQAINRGFVEGQIQGAIQMGIGFALTEEIEVAGNGQVKGDTFAKYHVVNAPDMPLVKVELIEAPDAQGPFGAKSVGEISACAIAPAIVNAIEHALNIELDALPATPERILKALKKGK